MLCPDVNILVNAFRPDAVHHRICRTWLDRTVMADAAFGLSPLALSAVVRITTNTRSYKMPSSLEDAFGFVQDLLGQPHCQIVEPGPRHWDIFQRICTQTNTRGAVVTDAWYAALAIEWGCEWITMDRDFARFPGLKWSLPA